MKNLFLSILLFFAACSFGFGQEELRKAFRFGDAHLNLGGTYHITNLLEFSSSTKYQLPQVGIQLGGGLEFVLNDTKEKYFVLQQDIFYQSHAQDDRWDLGRLAFSQVSSWTQLNLYFPYFGFGFGIKTIIDTKSKIVGGSPWYNSPVVEFPAINYGPTFGLRYKKNRLTLSANVAKPIKAAFTEFIPTGAVPPGPQNSKPPIKWGILETSINLSYTIKMSSL